MTAYLENTQPLLENKSKITKENFLGTIANIAKKSYSLSVEFLKLQSPASNTLAAEEWHVETEAGKDGITLTEEEIVQKAKAKLEEDRGSREKRADEIREETKALAILGKETDGMSSKLGVDAEEIRATNEQVRQKLVGEMLKKYREAISSRIRLSLEASLASSKGESREIAYKQNQFNDEANSLPSIGLEVFGVDRQQFDAINQEVTQQIKGEFLESYKNMCLEEASLFKLQSEVVPALKDSTNSKIRELQRRRVITGDFLISTMQVKDSAIKLIRDQILYKKELNVNKTNSEQKGSSFFRNIFDNLRNMFAPKLKGLGKANF